MQKRKLTRKLTLSKLLALVFMCAAAVILIKQQGEINYHNKKIAQLQSDIKTEEKLKKELEEKSAIYSSDYYIEKIAREELGLVMPDEKVFIDANGN